jgi:hypothetical protein
MTITFKCRFEMPVGLNCIKRRVGLAKAKKPKNNDYSAVYSVIIDVVQIA